MDLLFGKGSKSVGNVNGFVDVNYTGEFDRRRS